MSGRKVEREIAGGGKETFTVYLNNTPQSVNVESWKVVELGTQHVDQVIGEDRARVSEVEPDSYRCTFTCRDKGSAQTLKQRIAEEGSSSSQGVLFKRARKSLTITNCEGVRTTNDTRVNFTARFFKEEP